MQTFLYSAVSCAGIAALLILEHIARKSDLIALRNKRFFRLSIWLVIIVMLSELVTIYFEGAAVRYRWLSILGNVAGFALSPFVPLLIGCAIDGSHKKGLLWFALPAAINLVLSVFSAWFPIIFWVNAENGYMRGDAFGIYVFSYAVALILLLLQTLFMTRNYQNENHFLPIVLFLFVGMGTTGQVLVPWLHISWLCIAFALILYFIYCCDLLHQIDGLTGLLNRRTFEYNTHSLESGSNAAVIIFDVDEFKTINDTYGHPFGDHCLVAISSYIKKVFFKIGLCYRIGGDEFCVITRKTDKDAVEQACQRFLNTMESIRRVDSRLPQVSLGYAYADDKTESIKSVISRADQQMYQFKQQRKRNK